MAKPKILEIEEKIDEISVGFENKVDKDEEKVLSDNNFTNTLKSKLEGIENGANKTIVSTSVSASTSTVPSSSLLKEKSDKIDMIEESRPVIKIKEGSFLIEELTEGEIGFEIELV